VKLLNCLTSKISSLVKHLAHICYKCGVPGVFLFKIFKFLLLWQQRSVWINTLLNWITSKASGLLNHLAHTSCMSGVTARVIANFVSKFLNCCYHGNKARSGVNFNEIIKMANRQPRKPPVWCKNPGHICYTCRAIADFVLKFSNFRYHGNHSRSGVNFNDAVKLADTKNAPSVLTSCMYLTASNL